MRMARSRICLSYSISLGMVRGPPSLLSLDHTNRIHLTELSIAPELNERLVPQHARAALKSRGIDLDNFVPLTKEEMKAHLD